MDEEQGRITALEQRLDALENLLRDLGSEAEGHNLYWVSDKVDAVLNPHRWDRMGKGGTR